MASELYLVIRLSGVFDRIHHVTLPWTLIGRDPQCALHLGSSVVSRSHAILVRTSEGYVIRDVSSRNGTTLNGRPVTEANLEYADVLEIGPFQLQAFRDFASAEAEAGGKGESTQEESGPRCHNDDREWRVRQLSPTQRRVFDQFLFGQSEKEVARALQISIHTVHAHSKAIYAKLDVCSRAELLSIYLAHPAHYHVPHGEA